jgi:hypothetical protein
MSSFAGQIEARGGLISTNDPGRNGGAGTVYLKRKTDPYGTLIINNGSVRTIGWSTPLTNASPIILQKLIIGDGSQLESQVMLQIAERTVTSGINAMRVMDGSVLGDLTLTGSNQLSLSGRAVFGNLALSNSAVMSLDGAISANSLTMRSNAVVTAPGMVALDVTVSGAIIIDASSRMDAVGKGYEGGSNSNQTGGGPGVGSTAWNGNGGGYGGVGGISLQGTNSGGVYGSFSDPADFGSGGSFGYGYSVSGLGGRGGGLIRVIAQSLQVDGELSANGVAAPPPIPSYFQSDLGGGGGAGGTVNVKCQQLSGTGTIRANGGALLLNGANGGGGGGRVSVEFEDMSSFAGQIEARGGLISTNDPGRNGGAGTVYLKRKADPNGTLIVDNGGARTVGWSTPAQGTLQLQAWQIKGSAQVSAPGFVRVETGDPNYFLDLINKNRLEVGGLWVNGQWIYGDLMNLEAGFEANRPLIRFLTTPNIPYVIDVSTNFSIWTAVATNSSPNGVFELVETNALPQRFFRTRK